MALPDGVRRAIYAVAFPWILFTLVVYLFAFAGGMVAFGLVYSLSWHGGLSPLRVILVGVAVSAMFSGISSAFSSGSPLGSVFGTQFRAPRLQDYDRQRGGLNAAGLDYVNGF